MNKKELLVRNQDKIEIRSDAITCEFTPEEYAQMAEFISQFDITSAAQILDYGISAQKNLDSFTDGILQEVKNENLGETGELIKSVILKLNSCQSPEAKGIKSLFLRGKNFVKTVKLKYEEAYKSIEGVISQLNEKQFVLLKDAITLEKLFTQNEHYFKELSMYIEAGKQILENARITGDELYGKANETGNQLDVQKYNDFLNNMNRFEKKIHDLESTRIVSLQLFPQIRMMQQNNYALTEKLQYTILNTIPLWKNQFVISIGIQNSLEAVQLQKVVTDSTNELLKNNAVRLHQASVQTATELERAIVDVDTLKFINQELIDTLSEIIEIQKEGIESRKIAKKQIHTLESDLKTQLLTNPNNSFEGKTIESEKTNTPKLMLVP